jgi:trehalose 6-phosphate phosphatase
MVQAIGPDWALFLDLDGTLLDIAPTPDSVVVPPGLVDSLVRTSRRLDGALAVVTGRARAVADGLLAPLTLPGGFGHGAELRDTQGGLHGAEVSLPGHWPTLVEAAAASHPGLIAETKPHGVALHYRAAPEAREAARAALLSLLRGHEDDFALLPAHMAFELRLRGATKASPVQALMRSPPFAGRRPVFVGDDVTDEDGMAAARALGGLGLKVGRDFADPAHVRAWLAQGAGGQGSGHAAA